MIPLLLGVGTDILCVYLIRIGLVLYRPATQAWNYPPGYIYFGLIRVVFSVEATLLFEMSVCLNLKKRNKENVNFSFAIYDRGFIIVV